MTRRGIFVTVLFACLSSAGWADTPPAPQNSSTPPAGPVIPPKAIFEIADDGGALHQQSLMQCPAKLDGYTRDQLHVFDKAGFDVSCNYRGSQSDVTIYLTRRASAQFAQDFEGERQAILKRFADAAARDGAVPLPPGAEWKSAGFASNKGVQLDDLLLTQLSGWEFQIRATYLGGSTDATHKMVEDISALTLKTAGAHLAACAAAPPPERAGQSISDVDYVTTLALSGITMARLNPKPDPTPVWCAEGAFPLGQTNPVLWRNISFDGKVGDADRIVGSDPRIVEIRLDPAGGEVAAKKGATMEIYDVIIGNADSADLVGIFNGRPSPADLAKLVFSGGQIRVFAHFDQATKKLQLFTAKPAAGN
jgi:hypothetical protein